MEIKEVLWFNPANIGEKCIGILKTENKIYIGVGNGKTIKEDIELISEFGSKVSKEMLLNFLKEEEN